MDYDDCIQSLILGGFTVLLHICANSDHREEVVLRKYLSASFVKLPLSYD